VAQHRTRLGSCDVMRQNPYNAVLCLGHNNGTVTMWTPNITTPLVKMLCHKGAVTALAVDPTGHQLVTAGTILADDSRADSIGIHSSSSWVDRRQADKYERAAVCLSTTRDFVCTDRCKARQALASS
jgi:hypothetical protein